MMDNPSVKLLYTIISRAN